MSSHDFSPRQIVGIDLVRFSAAFMVMMFHLGFWMWAGPPTSTPLRVAGVAVQFGELGIFAFGRVGVEIFFVLSGFIIAYSAERASAYEFFRGRLARLVPAVWIIAPVTLVTAYAVHFAPRGELALMFLRSLLFFPIGPYIDGVYWTLGIEIAFYALVFMSILVGCLKWLPPVIAALGLISSVSWFMTLFTSPQPMRWGPSTLHERILELILFDHGCFFALGVFLWLSLLKKATALRCILMVCFVLGGLAEIWFWSRSLSAMSDGAMSPFLPGAVWILSVAGIILSVKGNRLLDGNQTFSKIARVLGLTTYRLYLFHDLVGAAAFGCLFRIGANKYFALFGIVSMSTAAALVVAVALEPRLWDGLRVSLDHISGQFRLARRSIRLQ